MAEVDTAMLAGQHADIRRETAVGFGDIRYNIASEHCKTNDVVRQEGQENVMATKDARHDILNNLYPAIDTAKDTLVEKVNTEADRTADRIMELRGLVGQRFHEVTHDIATVLQGQATLAKDVELNQLKGVIEGQKNTQYLADKIGLENEKTRNLINDLKYHDLNRGLVERNTALVECEADRRYWRHNADQSQFAGQWAQLQSQIQAFQSQLQETRQGMVNFGTMAGVGQTSTSNNVR
jgi:hypothetical protein